MKKFFSLIALVGVFAACQPEELTTVFEVKPAELTVYASSSSAAADFNESAVVYNPTMPHTIYGNSGYGVLAEGSLDVVASYAGLTLPAQTVRYPKVLAGGVGSVNVSFSFPFHEAGYEIKAVPVDTVDVSYKFWELKHANHGHGYADLQVLGEDKATELPFGQTFEAQMLENTNDYILIDSYEFKSFKGDSLAVASVNCTNNQFADLFEKAVGEYEDHEIEVIKEKNTFYVSAWTLYTVIGVVRTNVVKYNVTAVPVDPETTVALADEVIGTFNMISRDALSWPVEIAHPSHKSHYVEPTADGHYHGHGHGHGEFENAGGGLVEAE